MESLITQLEFWHWLTFGLVLIILEMLSPGVFLMWLGIAAGIVGLLMLVQPDMGWQTQMVLFALLSIASIIFWRWAQKHFSSESDNLHMNRRAEQYIGRTFNLLEPIVNGMGKIKVDDSTWKVQGEDAPAGTQVVVTGVDGVVFEVKIINKEG